MFPLSVDTQVIIAFKEHIVQQDKPCNLGVGHMDVPCLLSDTILTCSYPQHPQTLSHVLWKVVVTGAFPWAFLPLMPAPAF